MSFTVRAPEERLIIALDTLTISDAEAIVAKLPLIHTFKLGFALMYQRGFEKFADDLLAADKQIFFDAKLHDIPNTVARGVKAISERGFHFVTVHSAYDALQAAMGAKSESIKVMAVNALTSLHRDLAQDHMFKGMLSAIKAEVDGIIAAPRDLADPLAAELRQSFKHKPAVATPGVRIPGTPVNDHQRTGSVATALQNGADWLIVGRPIIESADPQSVADAFIALIKAVDQPHTTGSNP